MKKILTMEEYGDFLQGLNDRHTAGFFSWSNTRWLQSPNGIVLLYTLLFETDEDTIRAMAREKGDELATLLRQIIRDASGVSEEKFAELEKKQKEELEARTKEKELN